MAVNAKADRLFIGNIASLAESDGGQAQHFEALAVKDGLVLFAGSKAEALEYCNESTELADYSGRFIYPGILEGHCHGYLAGTRLLLEADLNGGNSEEEYLGIMKAFISSNPGFPEYRGAGWKGSQITPTAAMLDAICPDKPVYLNSFDGHSMWMNSAALKAAGIDRAAAEHWGSDIVRVDAEGNPTGYISEGPTNAIISSAKYTHEQKKQALLAWQEFAFSIGYTAVLDAGVTEGTAKLYKELVDEGLWKLRTYGVYLIPETAPDYLSFIDDAKRVAEECNSEYFRIIGMKVFMDGVVEAHTAWLQNDYSDAPGSTGVRRLSDRKRFIEVLKKSAENDFMVHCHTVGDGAVEFTLSCIETALKETGKENMRNALAHLQVVTPDQIERMAKVGIVPVVPPLWTIEAKFGIYEQEVSYLGKSRADAAYPIKSFFDAGCVPVFHSDYPISTAVSVPMSVYNAQTRKNPDQDYSQRRGVKECITAEQSLFSLTAGPAYSFYQEKHLGRLAPGYAANMTVFDRDLLSSDVESVAEAKPLATVIDGEEVYRDY